MPPLLYQVDAFTSTPFAGNPAAVCVLPSAPDSAASRGTTWMQQVAAEMNLSETAFLRPRQDGSYHLRWFTPTDEVDLCGHATLASAHVLWSDGFLATDASAEFETASGRLTALRKGNWTEMDFPADPIEPTEPSSALIDGLNGARIVDVGRSQRDFLVRLPSPDAVQSLQPNLSTLAQIDARGVIVTAEAEAEKVDFVSRFFAPAVGVPEDPVTGSSHCALGPYWAAQTNCTSLTGRQVSSREGTVRVHLDHANSDRVTLGGQAQTIFRGHLDA